MSASAFWPVTWPLVYVFVVLPPFDTNSYRWCKLPLTLLNPYICHSLLRQFDRGTSIRTRNRKCTFNRTDRTKTRHICTSSSEASVIKKMLRGLIKQVEEMEAGGESKQYITRHRRKWAHDLPHNPTTPCRNTAIIKYSPPFSFALLVSWSSILC